MARSSPARGPTGYEAGLRHARGEREAALLAALDAVHAAFENADQRLLSAAQSMTQDAAHVALLAGELLAGHALEQAPAAPSTRRWAAC